MAARHSLYLLSLALATSTVTAVKSSSACSPLPASGIVNGIDLFSPTSGSRSACSLNVTEHSNYFSPARVGSKSPYKCAKSVKQSDSGGSGIYAPASVFTDSTLPQHVIYAPATPPAEKMPVILFAQGACYDWGTMFRPLMKEWASHGYMVIADGAHEDDDASILLREGLPAMRNTIARSKTTAAFTLSALDWVKAGAAGGKYGAVDAKNVAVAGQSCGGQKAYSAAWKNGDVKALGLFNSALEDREKECLLGEFEQPIAHFSGGPLDIAHENAQKDHSLLSSPSIHASLDTGNLGTYLSPSGGAFGSLSTSWWDFVLKGSSVAGYTFLGANTSLPAQGWSVSARNWDKYEGLGARGPLANKRGLAAGKEAKGWMRPYAKRPRWAASPEPLP